MYNTHLMANHLDPILLIYSLASWLSIEVLCSFFTNVLVHSGCYNKNTIDWVACKQQKFIPHSSGGWEVQDQGSGRFSVWWEPTSWFIGCVLPICPHMVEGAEGPSGVSFIFPFMRAPSLRANHFPEALPPSTIMLGIRFQPVNSGGT